MSDDSLFPAPWRGTCDVIVRRHPQDGYLFEITSTDLERAERADTLHMLARIKQGGARTVSLPAALPVVRVLQGLNLTVDDRVLRVDTWARHWGTALGLVLASMFVAAVATENVYPLIAFGLLTSFFGGACSDISRNAPRVSRRRSNGLRASEASSASSSTSSRADGRAGHTFGVCSASHCVWSCAPPRRRSHRRYSCGRRRKGSRAHPPDRPDGDRNVCPLCGKIFISGSSPI